METVSLKHRGIPWSTTDINETLKMYKEGLSIEEISKSIGRTIDAIQKKLKDYNMANRRNDWTEEEEGKVVYLRTEGLSFKEIGIKLDRSDRSVQAKHVRLTIPQKKAVFKRKESTDNYRRVYKVNDSYFSNIDSQKKAYYLGFITADGYVISGINATRGKTKVNSLGIHIAIKDISFLEEFRSDIESNSPIKRTKAGSSVFRGRLISGTDSVTLRMSSEQIIKDLKEYGIVQNKTYICDFPRKLDKKYFPGFIAGLISGDGSIGLRNNHNRGVFSLRGSLAGTESLIKRVREILIENIGYNPDKKIFNYDTCKTLYILELNQKEVLNMYHWMKDSGTYLMDRKNKIIENYICNNPDKSNSKFKDVV